MSFRAGLRRAGTAGLLCALALPALAPAAEAGDAATARAQARQAADQVAGLRGQIAAAEGAYTRALEEVGQQVTGSVQAATTSSDATAAAGAAHAELVNTARAIYMSGGETALYASLLTASDTHDLSLRLTALSRVMAAMRSSARTADAAAGASSRGAAAAQQAADASVVTAVQVAERAQALQGLLDRAQGVLDRLSTQARRLTEAEDAAKALARARAEAAAATTAAIGSVRAQVPPADYFALYKAAAQTCPGMSWTLLAAVGQVESGHGRNNGPSSAGAVGPMQFMPRTFATYAVDGDHDGRTSPWSPADAVYTAARFLCAGGAGSPGGVQRALLRYNNAQWYVDLVLGVERAIAAAQT